MTITTRPEITCTFGAVASTHWLASGSGMAVLEAGGNAFDAAVATGFVLQLVQPHLVGPGGEVPIIAHDAKSGETFVVCGQGVAPAAATIDRFRSLGLDLVPGSGLLPATVPGAFGGWMLLLQRYGTMRLREVMQYVIHYAEHGYPISSRACQTISSVADTFRDHWPTSAAIYLPGGGVPNPGSRFTNRALAATYTRIVEEAEKTTSDRDGQIEAARAAFYQGFVAEAIASLCESTDVIDSSGRAHRGLLRFDDLASWRASVEPPVTYDYRGHRVCKAGPWSQGPVFLQQLSLLDGFDLDGMPTHGEEFVHTVVECAKLAFADREAFYGDPRFVDVPLDDLLDAGYAEERRKLIDDHASLELRPGSPANRDPVLAQRHRLAGHAASGTGEPTQVLNGPGDTVHVDVADRFGNLVAATPSGGWLQSSPIVPELGFCLGTRGQMFWLEDGLPASLAPGKRPRTTLTPSLAFRDGRPYLAFGTPGGDSQDQVSLLFFLRHVHHGKNLQEAIDAPAWYTSHFPSSFYPRNAFPGRVHIESRVGQPAIDALRQRGHEIVDTGPWSIGMLSATSLGADGFIRAAANPRDLQGYAVGR